ncbi:hypothetical protein MTO96_007359 [Rhipicephalus appendiculatus]
MDPSVARSRKGKPDANGSLSWAAGTHSSLSRLSRTCGLCWRVISQPRSGERRVRCRKANAVIVCARNPPHELWLGAGRSRGR